jgi:phosphoribosylformylglycinamidine cyclo-ligase
MTQPGGLTYASTGVNYNDMDPFKRLCQERAALTARNADRFGMRSVEDSRGESVHVMFEPLASSNLSNYYGHVEEGLGTKNLVADGMWKHTGLTYYDQLAQDTVAMIVNDMCTLGIIPVTVAMHLAVGSSDWFKDEKRVRNLVAGWGNACDLARCVWAGGETPTLKGIIVPEAALLSGSAFGIAKHHRLLYPASIQEGDSIVLLESSGIHANGLTLARSIADKLPEGYATKLSDGRMYGEALLDPTHIYCGFIEDCLDHGVDIRYGVNITGHGWRKLMRAPQPFAYVIEELPTQRPIFDFIQKHGPVSDDEAYGNLNMGAGFALFINPDHRGKFREVYTHYSNKRRFASIIAGRVEKSDVKKVVIRPKGLEYSAETLAVR